MNNLTSIPEIENILRLPRAGKIHLGIKVPYMKNGEQKERPKEVEYFVCPPEVQRELGEKPTELKIALPSNEISEIIPYAFKRYKQGAGLICKGNGTIAYQVKKDKNVRGFEEIVCPGKDCPHYPKDCKLSACLYVILPHVDTFRSYQIDTNSWNSIVNIINCLRRVQSQYQRLMNLHHPTTLEPILRLVRLPQETHGSGSKETHYTMSIYADMPLKLLREIRDGLSNPNLLNAPRPTQRKPGETPEEFKDRVQEDIDDLYPSPPAVKTVEAEVIDEPASESSQSPATTKTPAKKKATKKAAPTGDPDTMTPAQDHMPDGGALPGQEKDEEKLLQELKSDAWTLILNDLRWKPETYNETCMAITGNEHSISPTTMNKVELTQLIGVLKEKLEATK